MKCTVAHGVELFCTLTTVVGQLEINGIIDEEDNSTKKCSKFFLYIDIEERLIRSVGSACNITIRKLPRYSR